MSLEFKWNKNCIITSQQIGANFDGRNTVAPREIYERLTREVIWNKYRSQMTTEAINNNLNILIDPTFTNVNRLFVLANQTAHDRQSFSQFYLPKVMVKDFNVIINKLAFFDLPIKTEEEAYEKIIDISRNNEYTTGN